MVSRRCFSAGRRTGFTLVELLVVTTVFAILAGGMASTFLSGMRLWSRAQRQDAAQTDTLLALEVMAKELRQSAVLPSARLTGTSRDVSFPAALDDALVKVTYRYDADTKSVRRTQVDLREVLEGTLEPTAQEKALCSRVDSLLIEFGVFDKEKPEAGYEWKDSWDEKDGIPSAIRLTVTIAHEAVTKTVFLPIA